jgi:small-conductance mechanosensitive channel
MRLHPHIWPFAAGFVACVICCRLLAQPGALPAEAESSTVLPDPLLEGLLWEWQAQQAALEALRAQQQAALQAIELTRREIATSLSQSVDSTLVRLDTLNEALLAQSEHDLQFIRNSNRRVLTVVAGLAGLLFVGMLLVTLISTRAMNRLTAALSASPFAHPQLNPPAPAALLTESSSVQLLAALERLERRIAELENHSASHPSPEPKAQAA